MKQKINFKEKLNKFGKYLQDIVFPRNIKCIFCGEELNNKSTFSTCENCWQTLPFITNPCAKCGGNLNEEDESVCKMCKTYNHNFVQAFSVFEYRDNVLNLIHKIKYKQKQVLIKPLVNFLADKFMSENLQIDYITYVPMFPTKEKERGFNQAKILAEEFSSLVNIPCLDLCVKTINHPSQTHLTYKERQQNVKDTFQINKELKNLIKNKNILIVDDILTTGATSNELSKTILAANAKCCYVLTVGHVEVNIKQDN